MTQPVICEVAPRDGFQSITAPLLTSDKIGIIRDLAKAGCPRIEIGSFVSPKAVPQMADIQDISQAVHDLPIRISALVPNVRGTEDALRAGMKELVYVFSVSEAHNMNNVRQSVDQSIAGLEAVVAVLDKDIALRVDLATAFDCPFNGTVPIDALLQAVRRVAEIAPAAEIALCDTTGRANPFAVAARFAAVQRMGDAQTFTWAFHGHDTFGQGVANAMAAWGAGVRIFDTAAAGLGGCPFAPGATGNTATEDLIFAFNEDGIATGIDLNALLDVADRIADLPGGITGGHLRHVPRAAVVR